MNDFNTLEKLEEYFKKVNCYGRENCCFVCSTIQSTQFGLIGTLISVIKNKKVMGYLLNKNESGICLIPIIAETMTRNKVDLDNYIFIKNDDIDKIVIKNEEIGFKRIKILLKDKNKYVLKAAKKIINADYHKENLDKFIGMCT